MFHVKFARFFESPRIHNYHLLCFNLDLFQVCFHSMEGSKIGVRKDDRTLNILEYMRLCQ